MMSRCLVVLLPAAVAGWMLANCPPGDIAEPTGDVYCDCGPSGCECWQVVECVSACFPFDCADAAMSTVPTPTTTVTKLASGKLLITRMVVHTAKPLKTGPHIWVTTDPDTGKPAVVAAPVAAGTLSAKVQAKVVLLESALAEQIVSKCCILPVKR